MDMPRWHVGVEVSPFYWRWYVFVGPTLTEIWAGPIRVWVGGYDFAHNWFD